MLQTRRPARRPNPAFAAAAALVALHGARAWLDEGAQLALLREAAFVPARLWTSISPEWIGARLAAAPRESAQIAAYWLGDGAAPWSALSYALVHAGWGHALSNALLLALVGAPVARRAGAGRFFGLLALGALAGAAAQPRASAAAFANAVWRAQIGRTDSNFLRSFAGSRLPRSMRTRTASR